MDLHRLYALIFTHGGWRESRMAAFRERLQVSAECTVLDIGGYPSTWSDLDPLPSVTLLNLDPEMVRLARPESMRAHTGNACQMPQYADGEFAVAFSNSVIEHVGSWANQQRFAAEARRVADGIWIQTPAREFPLEPHYLTPLIHWLPRSWQKRLARVTVAAILGGWTRERCEGMVDELRLLSYPEVQRLFPDCEILVERFMGLPKSYIAVRGRRRPPHRDSLRLSSRPPGD